MFHNNISHTGFTQSPAPTADNLLWRFKTGGAIDSSPAVVNGIVYVGSRDHFVYALNAITGEQIWKFETGNQIEGSSPTVIDARVFVGSNDGCVYSFNASDGSLFWKYQAGGAFDSSPAVVDGKLYIGCSDTYVYSLNAISGNLLWKYKTGTRTASPTVVDGKVFISSLVPGFKFYCFGADTGDLLWSFSPRLNIISATPTVIDGMVFVGETSVPGWMYCLNENTGAIIWAREFELPMSSSPAIDEGKIFVGLK